MTTRQYYNQNSFWIKPAALLVGVFIILLYGIAPLAGAMQEQFAKLFQQRERSRSSASLEKNKTKYEAMNVKLNAEVNKLKLSQSKEGRLSSLYALLNQAASQAGVGFQGLRPNTEEEYPRYVQIPIEVSINDGYHKIGRFTNALEKSGSIVKVESLLMNAPRLDQDKVHATLKVSFYIMK